MNMKQFFKPILLAVTVTTGMLLSGCNSGLIQIHTVELDVIDTSNWYAQNQSATVLTIRSNIAEPIDVTNVLINMVNAVMKAIVDRWNIRSILRWGNV
jgi:hypothetical protein